MANHDEHEHYHDHPFTQEDAALFQIKLTRQLFASQAKSARDAFDKANILLETDFLVEPKRYKKSEAMILTADLRRGSNVFVVVYNPQSPQPYTVVRIDDETKLSGTIAQFDDREIEEFLRQVEELGALNQPGLYCITMVSDWFKDEETLPEPKLPSEITTHQQALESEGVFEIKQSAPPALPKPAFEIKAVQDVDDATVKPAKEVSLFEKLGIEPATDSIAQGAK